MKQSNRIRAKLGWIAVTLAPLWAAAFSIDQVAVKPSDPAPFGAEVTLDVLLNATGGPVEFEKPTEVERTGDSLLVTIYPGSPTFPEVGLKHLHSVRLGVFPIGTYQYKVRLIEVSPSGFQPKTVQGTFHVAPRLGVSMKENSVTLVWPAAATNFVLETAPSLSGTNGWMRVVAAPTLTNSDLAVTIRVASPLQVFRLRKE